MSPVQHSQPRPINGNSLKLDTVPPFPQSVNTLRSGHLTLDTMSPVNQNGSFEFDRVIKAGEVLKRTRRTKSWKPIHIVLRPNLLSIYRDTDETKLRHQITLSDLTAVARQRDPRGKAQHVFGLFSPSRNFHLEERTEKEAQEWVELIRREARIDEHEEDMTLASPGGQRSTYYGFERQHTGNISSAMVDRNTGYSSSDAEPVPMSFSARKDRGKAAASFGGRRASHTLDYSGPEGASFSDFSDSGPTARMSALSLSSPDNQQSAASVAYHQANVVYGNTPASAISPVNAGQASNLENHEPRPAPKESKEPDEERVLCHGWIYLLKSISGMRQWKKLWMVLRPKSLALYKNEEEYSAVLVIPFGGIIDAVDVDPISHSKRFCLQVLTEEKNYRMCAPDEDSLDRWLGAFKSLLVKRREQKQKRNE